MHYCTFIYKGVYGALFVAGIAATVFSMNEMVVVRTCLSHMTDLRINRSYFFITGQKS